MQNAAQSQFLLAGVVIFFSLTEAPLPDPTPTPPQPHPTDPKRTRNRPGGGAKRTRNGAETDRNQAFWGGTAGVFVGMEGRGVCKGKRKSLRWGLYFSFLFFSFFHSYFFLIFCLFARTKTWVLQQLRFESF